MTGRRFSYRQVLPAFICAVLAIHPAVAQIEDPVVSGLAEEAAVSIDRFLGTLPVLSAFLRERSEWHSEQFVSSPTEEWMGEFYHDEAARTVLELAHAIEGWEWASPTEPSLFFFLATSNPELRLSDEELHRIGSFVDRYHGEINGPEHRWLTEFSSSNIRAASEKDYDALVADVNEALGYIVLSADNRMVPGMFNDGGLPDDVFRALSDWTAGGEAVRTVRRIADRLERLESSRD